MPFKGFTTGQIKGLNEDPNPHRLEQGELSIGDNCARIGNMVGTRPGAVRPGSAEDYETQIDEGNPIQGLWEYRKDFDEGRVLVTVAEHTDFAGASGAGLCSEDDNRIGDGFAPYDGPGMTGGQDNVWTFASYQNQMFAAGGAAGDDFITWDGDTGADPVAVEIVDSLVARLRPQYVFGWNNYVLINGLRGGALADNNPMCSRYCDFGEDPTDLTKWNVANTLGYTAIELAGGGSFGKVHTTGFGSYEDNEGQWLLVLNNRSIQTYVLDTTNDFAFSDAVPNGCVGQRAFVSLGLDAGDAIYMSERGIHSLRQSQAHGLRADTFISEKIRETFKTLKRNRMKYACGDYDDQLGIVVFAVTTGSGSKHDLLLVLDVKDQDRITSDNARWYLWTLSGDLNINALHFGRDTSDNRRLYFGTTNGDVGYFDADVFSDFDSAGGVAQGYSVQMRTKDEDLGTTLSRKTLGDVMITLQPGGNYNPSMRFIFDYGARRSNVKPLTMPAVAGDSWGPTGGLTWGPTGDGEWSASTATRDDRVYGAGQFRTLGFDISHSASGQPFRVGKIDYQAAGSGEATGSAES